MVAQETYMGLTKNDITIIFKKFGSYELKQIGETILNVKDDNKGILSEAFNEALACCLKRERKSNKPIKVQKREFRESLKDLDKEKLEFLKELLLHIQGLNKEAEPNDLYNEVERAEISKSADKEYSKVMEKAQKKLNRKNRLEAKQKMKVKRLHDDYKYEDGR